MAQDLTFLADAPALDQDAHPISRVQLFKTGSFRHPRFGEFTVTQKTLDSFKRNFYEVSDGRGLPFDFDHEPQATGKTEACGWITGLDQLGEDGKTPTQDELWGTVEWNDAGAQAIRERRYRFCSPTFDRAYVSDDKSKHGPTLLGAALTNYPFLERMAVVSLSNVPNSELEKDGATFATDVSKGGCDADHMHPHERQALLDHLVENYDYVGFEPLAEKLQGQGHSKESADRIAAYIGRKKYGKKFNQPASEHHSNVDEQATAQLADAIAAHVITSSLADIAAVVPPFEFSVKPDPAPTPKHKQPKEQPPKNSSFESEHPRGTGGLFVQKGSSGGTVKAVQKKLGVKEDGQFGHVTEKAIRAFQRKHNLTVDGVIGRQTAAALLGSKRAHTFKTGTLTDKQKRKLADMSKQRTAEAPKQLAQAVFETNLLLAISDAARVG